MVDGATRATWGHDFRMTVILRAREAHNSVLLAPRGPNDKTSHYFNSLIISLGVGTWPHVSYKSKVRI